MSNTTTNTYTMANEIKVNSVKGANLTSVTWHRSYGQHGVYAKKAGIDFKSSMIWESQWNQIMIWISDVKNTAQGQYVYYVINPDKMPSISSSGTGQVKVKNVFDLSGGSTEVTLGVGYKGSYTSSNSRVYYAMRMEYDKLPSRTYSTYVYGGTDSHGLSRLVLY